MIPNNKLIKLFSLLMIFLVRYHLKVITQCNEKVVLILINESRNFAKKTKRENYGKAEWPSESSLIRLNPTNKPR